MRSEARAAEDYQISHYRYVVRAKRELAHSVKVIAPNADVRAVSAFAQDITCLLEHPTGEDRTPFVEPSVVDRVAVFLSLVTHLIESDRNGIIRSGVNAYRAGVRARGICVNLVSIGFAVNSADAVACGLLINRSRVRVACHVANGDRTFFAGIFIGFFNYIVIRTGKLRPFEIYGFSRSPYRKQRALLCKGNTLNVRERAFYTALACVAKLEETQLSGF